MADFSLQDLAKQQYGWSQEQMDRAKADRAKRDLYTQPAVDFYQRLTSGDPRAMGLALAPIKEQTAAGYRTARENVYGTTPRGAGQEFALAQLPIQAATSEAAGTYGAVTGGFDKLASIGSGYGNYALAETGAAATFSELAGRSESERLKIEAAKRGRTLDFLGNLAKLIGGGGFLSSIGKGISAAGKGIGSLFGIGGGGGGIAGASGAIESGPMVPGLTGPLSGGTGGAAGGLGTLGTVGAATGATAAGLGLAYLLSKSMLTKTEIRQKPGGPAIIQGGPTGMPGLFWLQTDNGMTQATAQQYYQATGQWPASWVNPTP